MLKLTYSVRLSGSENHGGFLLISELTPTLPVRSSSITVGEIYPFDEDGIEGEKIVKRVCLAVNHYEEMKEMVSIAYDRLRKLELEWSKADKVWCITAKALLTKLQQEEQKSPP